MLRFQCYDTGTVEENSIGGGGLFFRGWGCVSLEYCQI